MLVFPQLSSGATAQFPFRRELQHRTLVNLANDGSEIRVTDADFHHRVWELALNQLSEPEWQAIENLFLQTEGRLHSFLFLEPGSNLLAWSEKFSEAVWQADAGVSVVEGQADPFGGTGAGELTNSGGSGVFGQSLSAPASFRYAGSVWARTADPGAVFRVGDGGSEFVEAAIETNNQWKRYAVGYNLASAAEVVELHLVVPDGGTVQIYGPQLEAQSAPSLYKKTLQQAGLYSNTRFDQDTLADRMTDVGRHSGVIRIAWAPSLT